MVSVAVVGLVFEGVPLIWMCSGRARPARRRDSRAGGAAKSAVICRRACRQDEFAVAGGMIDVGSEGDAVAGLHGDAVFDGDVGAGLREGDGGEAEGESEQGLF